MCWPLSIGLCDQGGAVASVPLPALYARSTLTGRDVGLLRQFVTNPLKERLGARVWTPLQNKQSTCCRHPKYIGAPAWLLGGKRGEECGGQALTGERGRRSRGAGVCEARWAAAPGTSRQGSQRHRSLSWEGNPAGGTTLANAPVRLRQPPRAERATRR